MLVGGLGDRPSGYSVAVVLIPSAVKLIRMWCVNERYNSYNRSLRGRLDSLC
jgi:hypothetical protein